MEPVEYLLAPLLGQRLVDCPQQQPDGAPIVLLAVVGLAFLAALAELGLSALAEEPLDPDGARCLPEPRAVRVDAHLGRFALGFVNLRFDARDVGVDQGLEGQQVRLVHRADQFRVNATRLSIQVASVLYHRFPLLSSRAAAISRARQPAAAVIPRITTSRPYPRSRSATDSVCGAQKFVLFNGSVAGVDAAGDGGRPRLAVSDLTWRVVT